MLSIMSVLQNDVRMFTRVARKTRGNLLSVEDFNKKYNTNLPLTKESQLAFDRFNKSLNSARKRDGVPVRSRLFNLYGNLSTSAKPTVTPQRKRELIPPVTASLTPPSGRVVAQVTKKAKIEAVVEEKKIELETPPAAPEVKLENKAEPYTLENFKEDLEVWKKNNPNSKLNKETQVVYFVGNAKVENFEHFAAKLTRNVGAILETGGKFKMRSGVKKEILGVDQKVAQEIVANVTKGGKGPFFLPIACNTGAKECKC